MYMYTYTYTCTCTCTLYSERMGLMVHCSCVAHTSRMMPPQWETPVRLSGLRSLRHPSTPSRMPTSTRITITRDREQMMMPKAYLITKGGREGGREGEREGGREGEREGRERRREGGGEGGAEGRGG